jgi:hypothetical protein
MSWGWSRRRAGSLLYDRRRTSSFHLWFCHGPCRCAADHKHEQHDHAPQSCCRKQPSGCLHTFPLESLLHFHRNTCPIVVYLKRPLRPFGWLNGYSTRPGAGIADTRANGLEADVPLSFDVCGPVAMTNGAWPCRVDGVDPRHDPNGLAPGVNDETTGSQAPNHSTGTPRRKSSQVGITWILKCSIR